MFKINTCATGQHVGLYLYIGILSALMKPSDRTRTDEVCPIIDAAVTLQHIGARH